MPKTYNEIVSVAREGARDALRLRNVQTRRSRISAHELDLKSLEDEQAAINKQIAIADFKLSNLEDRDPEFADKTKMYEDQKVSYQKQLEAVNKDKETVQKAIEVLKEEITKWQSGELKVNLSELDDLAQSYLADIARQAAIEKAAE